MKKFDVFMMQLTGIGFIACAFWCLSGCTLSFQNIATKGTATDVVDENQNASPTVTADFESPIVGE